MWLFKTRNRIKNTKRFITAWRETEASENVYVRLDDDDSNLQEYLSLDWPKSFEIVVGDRVMLSAAMQEMFLKYPHEHSYGLLADDLIPKTKMWDVIISTEASKNKIVAFNECLSSKYVGNFEHMCVSGDIIRSVGWFGLPATTHYYVDVVWRHISKNRPDLFVYLEDVVIQHLHPIHNNEISIDSTYRLSRDYKKIDKDNYWAWYSENFLKILEKLNMDFSKQKSSQ
jgi:hypothetical protein